MALVLYICRPEPDKWHLMYFCWSELLNGHYFSYVSPRTCLMILCMAVMTKLRHQWSLLANVLAVHGTFHIYIWYNSCVAMMMLIFNVQWLSNLCTNICMQICDHD